MGTCFPTTFCSSSLTSLVVDIPGSGDDESELGTTQHPPKRLCSGVLEDPPGYVDAITAQEPVFGIRSSSQEPFTLQDPFTSPSPRRFGQDGIDEENYIPLPNSQDSDTPLSQKKEEEPEVPWSPPPPPETPLSEDQTKILNMVLSGKNTFFTGPAGSGKSLLISHIKYAFDYPPIPDHVDKTGDNWEIWCKNNRTRYAVTAPTGIAAVLIGGSTIHSWSGVGLGQNGLNSYLNSFRPPAPGRKAVHKVKPWLMTDVLILDEVSMLNPDLFELLNIIGKRVRSRSDRPFGGIRVICSGDFFQLPPVEQDSSRKCAQCGT